MTYDNSPEREEIRAARRLRRPVKNLARAEARRALEAARRAEKDAGRAERAKGKLENLVGREVTGSVSMLATLRYLMGGGYPFFGLHGGAIEPFFRALYTDKAFCRNYVTVPEEQIGGNAAVGFAEATGKVGVSIFTSGPGILNALTSIYTAMMDSIPAVFISGNVPQPVAGSKAFQEADVVGVSTPISKKVFYITNAGDLASTLVEAFRLAKSGRPGPVVVDVPKNVLIEKTTFTLPDLESLVSAEPFDAGQLAGIPERIAAAKRPVVYVGGGIRPAEARVVREFATKTGIPVAYTLKGKGAIPDNHQLCIGSLGMHGLFAANKAVNEADLLIVVGARFDDRVAGKPDSFAPNAYIAHFDIDPQGIGPKKRQPDAVIKGDLKLSLKSLTDLVRAPADLSEWYAKIDQWKKEHPFSYEKKEDIIMPQLVYQTINDILKDEPRVTYVLDVGQNLMWGMQYLQPSDPRCFLTSGGAGTMTYSFSAALGAALANPEKKVVAIMGDLGFRMRCTALGLYKSLEAENGLKLNIKIVVIDNDAGVPGGMVKQWLNRSVEKMVNIKGAENLPPIDQIARGYGINASEVREPGKVYGSLKQMLGSPGVQLLNFKVDPSEEVYPFIPPGGTVEDTEFGPKRGMESPASLS